jgi:pyruvate, orthophosphate dikinase
MPGMMDTVLNLGLNDETVAGLARRSGDERFAYDSYRRFIQMYSDVVLGVDQHEFEEILDEYKDDNGHSLDTHLTAEEWKEIVERYKALVAETTGEPFPLDVADQLWGAIGAVFGSWNSARAVTYRKLHNIPHDWGTAVNVQAMVFGNMGETSATGVAFTRNPATGAREVYGEFLVNAQGEDVVSGIRTPQYLTEDARQAAGSEEPSLEAVMPEIFAELTGIFDRLERHYRDMQDIEFTIQDGRLWMLQTRAGKRTTGGAQDRRRHGRRRPDRKVRRGGAHRPGHARPAAAPDPRPRRQARRAGHRPARLAGRGRRRDRVRFRRGGELKALGRQVILVRVETSPEDIHGMHAAEGILTTRGGMTSHAAVVARGMGKPCVSGAGAIQVDYARERMTASGVTLAKGEVITLDGSTGQVMRGAIPTVKPEMSGEFETVMGWADEIRRLGIRANADTPADARIAREFGAEGIGLCRTEHMFFEAERIAAVREMILADSAEGRRAALDKILPMQRQDFASLFEIMGGLPVTIRLLDPPLHEFLPGSPDEIREVAEVAIGVDAEKLKYRVAELKEVNPMLGHRGVRIAISYPEIAEMQARAIFEAVVEAGASTGAPPIPEVMVPLIATRAEFDIIHARIRAVAEQVEAESGQAIAYLVGTMIELPRACLMAADIARRRSSSPSAPTT